MVRLLTLCLVFAAAFLALAAPVAGAADATEDADPKPLNVTAAEGDCPEGQTFCIRITHAPANLTAGDTVNLTFTNEGNTDHNLHVTDNQSADPDHQDTPAEAAIASTPTIPPGGNATTNFTVPDADALYLWGDREAHEAADEWETLPLHRNETAGNDTDDNQTGDDETDDEKGGDDGDEEEGPPPGIPTERPAERRSPMGPVAAVALAVTALVARLRRGRPPGEASRPGSETRRGGARDE